MNFRGWWEWSAAHQARELGLMFIVLGATRFIVLPLVGRRLYVAAREIRAERRSGWQLLMCLAFAFLGAAVEESFGLIANIDTPRGNASGGITYSTWFAWWFWGGKFVGWATAMWLSWLVLLPHNKPKIDKDMLDAARRREQP